MPGASGQDRHIPGLDLQLFTRVAAETHARSARSDTEHLMDLRVIVHERIDSVVPETMTPIIAAKCRLNLRNEITSLERALVDEERQAVVRNRAVIGEEKCRWFDLVWRHGSYLGAGTNRRTAGAKMF